MQEFSFNTESKIVVYNPLDARVIFSQNAENETKIASLTKIMTAIVAIENNEMSKIVEITPEMTGGLEGYSVIWLASGQKVPTVDLIYATLLPSAGDAAQALAISTSGSIEKFVEKMNEKAEELGLTHTHFSNVVGFDEENYSSAGDMAKLLDYALKNPTFLEVFSAFRYDSTTLQRTFLKTIEKNPMIIGAKTGFTYEAGRNLASLGEASGEKLIVIDLNENYETNDHVDNTLKILDFYNKNYQRQNILEENEKLTEVEVKDSFTKSIEIFSDEEVEKYLPKNFDRNSLQKNFEQSGEVKKGSKVGEYLGKYSIKYDEEILYTKDIFLEEEIYFFHYEIWNAAVVAIFLASAWIIIRKWRKNHCKARRNG